MLSLLRYAAKKNCLQFPKYIATAPQNNLSLEFEHTNVR